MEHAQEETCAIFVFVIPCLPVGTEHSQCSLSIEFWWSGNEWQVNTTESKDRVSALNLSGRKLGCLTGLGAALCL